MLVLVCSGCAGSDAIGGGLAGSDRCDGRCRIALDTIAVLGALTDTVWPAMMSSAIRAANGSYYVGASDHPGSLLIYDAQGTLTRTFGRRGQGPGEYSSILMEMVRGPADTISVVEVLRNRRVIIDSIGRTIRSHPVPFQFYSMVHLDNRVLVQADIRSPDTRGWSLHEVDAEGTVVRSYAEQPDYRNPEVDGFRPVAAAVDGGVWLAASKRYELTYYDRDFNAVNTITPETRWFPPNDGMMGDAYTAPQPWIADLWQAPDSLLWVVVRVVDADWTEGVLASAERMDVRTFSMKFDWLLEVVDPRHGTRIASFRHRDPLMFGLGDNMLYGMSEDDNGRVVITALRPRLR